MLIEARINALLAKMIEGWQRGNGALFAEPFSNNAHFVAFDGSAYDGREAIAAFHQQAFDTNLKGTVLDLTVTSINQIDQKTWLVFAKGFHMAGNAPTSTRISESATIFVCQASETKSEVLAFQNTRVRPISGLAAAEVWRAFDRSWERLQAIDQ